MLSEGQMSDYKGAALILSALPEAKGLLGDRGYDADWFRKALDERGITACIPGRSNRKIPIGVLRFARPGMQATIPLCLAQI
jgi:transposase